jgi:putative DNA primase/helicase
MKNGPNHDGSATAGSYEAFPLTDSGNAERMAYLYGEDLKYVSAWKTWLYWTGTHWSKDAKNSIYLAAQRTARSIREEAIGTPAEVYAKISGWAANSESEWRLRAMIHLCESQKVVARVPQDFDRDADLLNCRNGTIDLEKGELREHSRGDMISKCVPVNYYQEGDSGRWEKFLTDVQPDPEVRKYLQRAVGYTLSGSVGEQCLFFLYGDGANGKTTFVEAVKSVLGGYAVKVESAALMSRVNLRGGSNGGATPNLARLFGARMASTTEIQEGAYLNEALIKDITGGDTIVARHLYSSLFEFRPTHKLWISGNHRPRVKGMDSAIWRRFRVVPFEVAIPKGRQDRRLLEKLRGEEGQEEILRWAVQGYLKWRMEGLGEPLAIGSATEEYQDSEDRIGKFIEDCCNVGGSGVGGSEDVAVRVKAANLYGVYTDWCKSNGMEPLNSRNFGSALSRRGFEGRKVGGPYWRYGLCLKRGSWGI